MDSKDQEWTELAILCAVSAGASPADLARLTGDGPAPDASAVPDVLMDLERRGLIRRPSGDSGVQTPILTDEGRGLVLAQLTDLAARAEKLEEERLHVERLRTDFLATISHELRTPLTLIRTSIGLLLDSEPDEEMRLRLLRNISQSTSRMHLLVTDLLDLARLRGDRLELQVRSVDLGELIAGAIALLRPLLDEKAQMVETILPSPPPVAPGDYRRLERVLLNLLGNANIFAEAGTRMVVSVSEAPGEVIVAVRDSGPGIPPEAMPHLFDQFFTARTSSSRFNIGAGLGLPIAKGIVEAHGGRIWVESGAGAGTTVSFALPTAWSEEETDEDPGRR
jgi:signal transduction histidine kinase